ncbi:hypothetical protein D8674_010394 [Pyrus ussuriensis x Pyrus communis]|uniref:Uncharacterized protein n=1 Tax=Pyrus ussuriensis x Pyrus communis TaxID=2448454 RepID=A0A5N5FBB6_9ROSA|nr:hypothetical protein D8674_010394 [Pyrus ussuriensis x Pyrus communis]
MVVRKVGKYEVGRTIGEGNFAKVEYPNMNRNTCRAVELGASLVSKLGASLCNLLQLELGARSKVQVWKQLELWKIMSKIFLLWKQLELGASLVSKLYIHCMYYRDISM